MAEEIDIPLLKNTLLPVQDANMFLSALFTDKLNHALMCSRLERYHWGSGTSPQVNDFLIEMVKTETGGYSGSFRCRYRVGYSFTCSGIESGENSTIDWRYNIDNRSKSIHFNGEEPLVRDSDDC